MATKRILLTRLWDGHPEGEIIEEADFTVDSMVRKGYGREITRREEKKIAKEVTKMAGGKSGKGPLAETADATPHGEAEVITPQVDGQEGGDD